MNKKHVMLAGLVTGALVLGACGSDSDVEVEGAWARNSPMAVTLGAAYFDLTVAEDDRLVGAQVPADVAASAEIHEVVESEMEMSGDMEMSEEMSGDMEMSEEMSGDMDDMEMSEGSHDDTGDMDMGGMMTMQEMEDGLALSGGETVSFEPGGYHVMLIDLADPLEVGDEFELTLEFENADSTTVTVEVRESAP